MLKAGLAFCVVLTAMCFALAVQHAPASGSLTEMLPSLLWSGACLLFLTVGVVLAGVLRRD